MVVCCRAGCALCNIQSSWSLWDWEDLKQLQQHCSERNSVYLQAVGVHLCGRTVMYLGRLHLSGACGSALSSLLHHVADGLPVSMHGARSWVPVGAMQGVCIIPASGNYSLVEHCACSPTVLFSGVACCVCRCVCPRGGLTLLPPHGPDLPSVVVKMQQEDLLLATSHMYLLLAKVWHTMMVLKCSCHEAACDVHT